MRNRFVVLAVVALLGSRAAMAQTAAPTILVAPTAATFGYTVAELAQVATFHIDFFVCQTITVQGCTATATPPTGAGVDVPVAVVTDTHTTRVVGTATLEVFLIDWTTTALHTALLALPPSTPFVATITATGLTGSGVTGTTGRSNVTQPFFPQSSGLPVLPGSFQIQQ